MTVSENAGSEVDDPSTGVFRLPRGVCYDDWGRWKKEVVRTIGTDLIVMCQNGRHVDWLVNIFGAR